MAKKKSKKNQEPEISIMRYEPPKPRINEKKIKAMEEILKDEGCRHLGREEMRSIVDAYKAGKRSKGGK